MTRSSSSVAVCIALLAALLVASSQAKAVKPAAQPAISCGTVTTTLAPCFEYILSGGVVPVNCCNGVKSLFKLADSTPKRRSICTCLTSITKTASPTVISNAKVLPGKCGVSLPYQITPAIDCAKIT